MGLLLAKGGDPISFDEFEWEVADVEAGVFGLWAETCSWPVTKTGHSLMKCPTSPHLKHAYGFEMSGVRDWLPFKGRMLFHALERTGLVGLLWFF